MMLRRNSQPAALVDLQLSAIRSNPSFIDRFGSGKDGRWLARIGSEEAGSGLARYIASAIERFGSAEDATTLAAQYVDGNDLTARITIPGQGHQWFLIEFADRAGAGATTGVVSATEDEESITRCLHELYQPLQSLALLQGILATGLTHAREIELLRGMEHCVAALSGMLTMLGDRLVEHSLDPVPQIGTFAVSDVLAPLSDEFAYHAQARGGRWRVVPSGALVRSDRTLLLRLTRMVLAQALGERRGDTFLLGARRRHGRLAIELWGSAGRGDGDVSNRAASDSDRSRGRGLFTSEAMRQARALSKLVGGDFHVAAGPGDGLLAQVLVPLGDSGETPSESPADTHRETAASNQLTEGLLSPRATDSRGRVGWTVFIVDDDRALAQAMCDILQDRYPVRTFDSAERFLAAINKWAVTPTGCVLVDVNLPYMDGFQLLEIVQRKQIGLPCIMITAHGDTRKAVRAMRAGAIDFIEKPIHVKALVNVVEMAREEGEDQGTGLVDESTADMLSQLSPRQSQILDLIVEGNTNREIATILHISSRTVENHRAELMRRTKSRSLSDLIKLSLKYRR